MRASTDWPIPAPEVIRATLATPLRGLWVDHVPTGAELAAMDLLCTGDPDEAWADPLATGDWESYRYVWLGPHPEETSPQRVMPDAWFDHAQARRLPPTFERYEPKGGQTVRDIIDSSLSGSGHREEAQSLPRLWEKGLLASARERALANHLLRNACAAQWYRMMLDERWTVRRAAEVLREAGIARGDLCALTNRWARPPPGTPEPGSGPAQRAEKLVETCLRQLADDGGWPLARTAEIAAERGYERME